MIGDGVKKIPNTFGVDVSAASFLNTVRKMNCVRGLWQEVLPCLICI